MKFLKYIILPLSFVYGLAAKQVAISVIAHHPSLERIQAGIEDVLKDYDPSIKIIVDNANGNPTTAAQIATKMISKKPDVLVGIGTLAAQTLHGANNGKIPLVFSAVTDPYTAQLIPKTGRPEHPITGSIDLPPTRDQVIFMKEQFPHVKTIGILYNPGEVNAISQIQAFEDEAHTYKILKAPAVKTVDVLESGKKLAPQVDLLYIPNDNTVVSAIEAVVQVANQANIPVFTSDPESLERGATAALAHDQYDIGVKTGELIVRILKGENAQDIPVIDTFNLIKVNKQTCAAKKH